MFRYCWPANDTKKSSAFISTVWIEIEKLMVKKKLPADIIAREDLAANGPRYVMMMTRSEVIVRFNLLLFHLCMHVLNEMMYRECPDYLRPMPDTSLRRRRYFPLMLWSQRVRND